MRGKRKNVLIFISVIFLLLLSNANAAVLTFEDLYTGSKKYNPLPSGYGGFTWNSDAYWITKYYHPGTGYEYGTIGNVSMFTGWAHGVSMSNTVVPFDFTGAYITAAWNSTENVVVEGRKGGNLIYSQTITTYNNAPYWFNFNFLNVDTVWIRPIRPSGSCFGHLVIDNITYTPIPEPTTMLLLGGGLLGLAAFGRARKRKI